MDRARYAVDAVVIEGRSIRSVATSIDMSKSWVAKQVAQGSAAGSIDAVTCTLHDLRHTGRTWSSAAGATTAELMHRAGHASPRVAMRYQHATEERVAPSWHNYGMPRTRVSTTVDEQLLESARSVRRGKPDSALLDEALGALLSKHRAAEVDASYAAYDEHPLTEVDEWGDLASFREAAAAS